MSSSRTLQTALQTGWWLAAFGLAIGTAHAKPFVQCPGDQDQDAVPDAPDPAHPNAKCMHLAAGDGFARMGDGRVLYTFGFSDVTGIPLADAMARGMLAANLPAPTIALEAGQEFYLNVTNVGMMMRPDLFDPHTVHFHGFPNASAIFDGMPDGAIAVNMGETLAYYYQIVHPGTYMYHCHVEATEHMQMGMLGNLYVKPLQNQLPEGTDLSGFPHTAGQEYVYDDGDGSTRYDVEYPIQLGSLDPAFHEASLNVQPLPFAALHDTYPLLNGRGYPDTVNPSPLPPPLETGLPSDEPVQRVSSLIVAQVGQRILLRISNLNVTSYYTIGLMGLEMRVVGHGARELRGPGGRRLHYDTASVTLGGGESVDAIIDTARVPPGTYFLYTTNLNYLSNDAEDFGGMMTEIVITQPA